jgi:hypothetical protein
MRIKHICPAISITIRGVDFLAYLIVLDSKGIDIILGMDWLRKYDGVILCAKTAIRLTREDGTTMPRYKQSKSVCSIKCKEPL